MFKGIGNIFAKLSLGAIVRNITLDIDTVEKANGYFLRVRVEAFGFKILDELVKLSDQTSKKMKVNDVLHLKEPINEFRTNDQQAMMDVLKKRANERLREATQ